MGWNGIKDFFSEEVLRALPPKTMWQFVFVVPPRKKIVGQGKSTVGGVFDRGDNVLGEAGRQTMGTHGLTCKGGYQPRHYREMDSRPVGDSKCCASLAVQQPAESDPSRSSS